MTAEPSKHAITQYTTTSSNLSARLAIHAYNTHSSGWFAWAGERIAPSGSVLEVGAGTGELWRHTPTTTISQLVLTDFSPAMCTLLRSLPNATTVVQCDATRLPFPDASFDTVIANHMLYHIDEPAAALAEFARVLRPDGRVAVALNGRDHLDELLTVGAAVGRPSVILDQARIVAETARERIEKCFVDVHEERFPGAFEVPAPEPVLAYLGSLGDAGPLQGEQEAAARALVEKKIADEGCFRITKNMVLFTARRP